MLTTRDTSRVIDPDAERRLLDYYIAGLARRGFACPDAGAFINSYHLCVLQHALKVIGRFNALERQGKSGIRGVHSVCGRAGAPDVYGLLAMHPGERTKDDFPRLRAAFDVG